MDSRTCIVLGEQSLLIQCIQRLLDADWRVQAVVSPSPAVQQWCAAQGLPWHQQAGELPARFAPGAVDWLFSITWLQLLPEPILALGRNTANFHDGPLPRYAGLNTPVWALWNGETEYGVTWHRMEGGADRGEILVQRKFAIEAEDTAFTLNARCYEEGLAGFDTLLAAIAADNVSGQPQSFAERSVYRRDQRPTAAATLDWSQPAARLAAQVRALDHGNYPNPLALPKLWLGDAPLMVQHAEPQTASGRAGELLAVSHDSLTVACGEQALRLQGLRKACGQPVDVAAHLARRGLATGHILPALTAAQIDAVDTALAATARHEPRWQRALAALEPAAWPLPGAVRHADPRTLQLSLPAALADDAAFRAAPQAWLAAAHGLFIARLHDRERCHLGLQVQPDPVLDSVPGYFSELLPLPLVPDWTADFSAWQAALAPWLTAAAAGGYASDLILRQQLSSPGDLPLRLSLAATAPALPPGVDWQIHIASDGTCQWQLAHEAETLVASFER
ncbi:MAG: formyltransferase family protein, partial [Spongiibacteraceae bacterium]|nr:formyltransferase family protein [Spongiibacteraceae bacterium]